jgi:hypothetical protein
MFDSPIELYGEWSDSLAQAHHSAPRAVPIVGHAFLEWLERPSDDEDESSKENALWQVKDSWQRRLTSCHTKHRPKTLLPAYRTKRLQMIIEEDADDDEDCLCSQLTFHLPLHVANRFDSNQHAMRVVITAGSTIADRTETAVILSELSFAK